MIKSSRLLLCGIVFAPNIVFASGCFIVKEKDHMIHQEGDCDKRYAPCSSFKIALALMGYDAGLLKDEGNPQWRFKPEYEAFLESWKDPQTPTSWIKNSCVWYSQVLTQRLGMEKFQDYVTKFSYGNQDLSGDKGQNNGLTKAWLSSSLEISSVEQIAFLEKMLSGALPVSQHAHTMTRNILFVGELKNGWTLYGKTGSGVLLSPDRTKKLDIKHGWFIGWIEKGHRRIVFSNHITDDKKEESHAGPRAKETAKERLIKIIDQMEANK